MQDWVYWDVRMNLETNESIARFQRTSSEMNAELCIPMHATVAPFKTTTKARNPEWRSLSLPDYRRTCSKHSHHIIMLAVTSHHYHHRSHHHQTLNPITSSSYTAAANIQPELNHLNTSTQNSCRDTRIVGLWVDILWKSSSIETP